MENVMENTGLKDENLPPVVIGFIHMYRGMRVEDNRAVGGGELFVNALLDEFHRQGRRTKLVPANKSRHRIFDVLLSTVCGGVKAVTDMRKFRAYTRLFWSAENPGRFGIKDKLIAQNVNIFLGFVRNRGGQYRNSGDPPSLIRRVRFPNWIYYWDFLSNDSKALLNIVQPSRFQLLPNDFPSRKLRGCLIARNGNNGKRRALINNIREKGLPVDCPGRVGKNMETVENTVGIRNRRKAKSMFLKQYVFNVCPENSRAPGYVTEKIMQACMSGCVPIYWGDPHLEPGIINPKRVVLCQNAKMLGQEPAARLNEIIGDPQKMENFFAQPQFLPSAVQAILKIRDDFRDTVTVMIKRSDNGRARTASKKNKEIIAVVRK